ncbi:MAG TPA: response regulator [Candidatus Ratteibacteria bacterium]|jgi:DNA-binding response OmpR family regulator|uniref:Response regulator receiver domain protein n=1 Tax=candidate division TA06 bacterium ADurb.Bin131 TaxID=1852827 RepID=A0A1V6CE39_UNCT6|nr:MAG: Response regulator receiver domain protein [candidate division TA06 bacterium ADurb.Bin131]HOC02162.1 response regulator [bacterium]HRS06524.1 response regulator [Candidatus Ratteibacteria bacterium]HON05938.1 response regulator [bacterium]HPC28898.1 response regulator [bacterium]
MVDTGDEKTTQNAKVVMIVEDDDTIRKLLVIECKRRGFEVLEYRDASSAMAVIDRNKPEIDVAIVDLMNMGYGGNLGGYLKGFNQYQTTKVIYYTALAENQFNKNILDVPNTYYVHKVPGSIKTVIEIVEKT